MPGPDSLPVADREAAVSEDARLPLRIWLRLLTCTAMTEAMVRARLHAQFATTLPRFDVLAALDAAGTDLAMGALSARLMVTSGNVTGLINAMEKDGLVARRPHPADRRSTLIGMTEAGRALFARMAPAHAQWIEEAMAELDRGDAAQLWELLGRLKDSVRAAETVAPVAGPARAGRGGGGLKRV
jgi:DNA-binding MarR family transcriptional regulator